MKKKISRRSFMKAMGLGVGGLALGRSPMVLSALAASSEPIDNMIIGSGFGGSVTALRLANQGIDTVMLERGRRWPVTHEQNTFSSLQNPDGRSAWLSDFALLGEPNAIDRYIGVLELIVGNGIAALAGAGVGGGSLVYAAALYQPTQRLFEQAFTDSLNYEEMDDIYYPRVRSIINPRSIPKRILAQPEYAGARNWLRLGELAGLESKLVELGLSWRVVKKELKGERVASAIAGEFWYGNNSGAKKSLDKNYLRYAEDSGYLDIQTQQNVTAIEEGPDGRYVVTADEIDENGNPIVQRKYVVNKLFLAAGSMATSKLLVRAKGRNELPALNYEVGNNWGNNGDFFSQITGLPQNIKPHLGGTVPVAIEDHNNPIVPTTVECYADWRFEGVDGLIPSVGMSTPPANGRFIYDSSTDQVSLNWPASDPEITQISDAGTETYAKIAAAWGLGREHIHKVRSGHCEMNQPHMHSGATQNPIFAGITAHPLGGVVLDRATDNIGMVQNYQGLYVMDGALVPGHTGCANPALTIAALAERNIEKILLRDF